MLSHKAAEVFPICCCYLIIRILFFPADKKYPKVEQKIKDIVVAIIIIINCLPIIIIIIITVNNVYIIMMVLSQNCMLQLQDHLIQC